jgi:hypothetical protein
MRVDNRRLREYSRQIFKVTTVWIKKWGNRRVMGCEGEMIVRVVHQRM